MPRELQRSFLIKGELFYSFLLCLSPNEASASANSSPVLLCAGNRAVEPRPHQLGHTRLFLALPNNEWDCCPFLDSGSFSFNCLFNCSGQLPSPLHFLPFSWCSSPNMASPKELPSILLFCASFQAPCISSHGLPNLKALCAVDELMRFGKLACESGGQVSWCG